MGVYIGEPYMEVEYIQSSGTQCINTGFNVTKNSKIFVDIQFTSTTVQQRVFGVDNGLNGVSMGSYINGSGKYSRFIGNGGSSFTFQATTITADTSRHTFTLDNSRYIITTGGSKVSDTANSQTITNNPTNNQLAILAQYGPNEDAYYNYASAKLYACKIWDNDVLVRDFVPCYKTSNNEIGLFDKVENKFYANSGTGTFTKGNDVKLFQPELKNAYIGEYKRKSGIYHNATLGLISISDGQTGITITDKNLGATQVYNVGDTLSSSNCGYMYQRGNNYGFSSIGTISTNTNTAVNTSSYSWQNPYSGSPFIVWTSGSPDDWSSNDNPNLWGDTTNTKIARKGPCLDGFHVATQSERGSLITTMTALGISTSQGNKYQQYLKIPFAGYRKYSSGGSVTNQGTWACLWSTTTFNNQYNSRKAYDLWITSSVAGNTDNSMRAGGLNIRPMKNEPVIPDDTRTVLYQPN